MQTLTDFYWQVQSVSFEGETNRSIPDIDGDETKAEWRFFVKYYSESTVTSAWIRSSLYYAYNYYNGNNNCIIPLCIGIVIRDNKIMWHNYENFTCRL